MKLFPGHPYFETALWAVMGVSSVLLFFFAATVIALLLRRKRYRWLWLALPILALAYFMEQCFGMAMNGGAHTQTAADIVSRFAATPDWLLLTILIAMAAALSVLFWNIHRYEKSRITGMSIKEATDSLPSGILCYASDGRVLLKNRVMEDFCQSVTGEALLSGEVFSRRLRKGALTPGCRTITVGEEPVTVLADGTAWKISAQEIPFEKHRVQMLLASDITEAYRKTEELRAMQRKVTALNERLAKVNQEIVALTVEREVLNAKVKLHDELGSNLLAMKHYCLAGGTETELAEIVRRLRRNISFLKTETPTTVRDEYELLTEMAARLRVALLVTGSLPQTEPQKHIVAVAIHECMTNTVRHAHGNELQIRVVEGEERMIVTFTNNGEAPAGEIEEKGGLASLRELTEKAGGTMTVLTEPSFAIRLELPKEVENAL